MLLRLSSAQPRTLVFYPTPPPSNLPGPLKATVVTHLDAILTSHLAGVASKALSTPKFLPQPLYLQHLQRALTSVASKRLITPLSATLTELPATTPLNATLTKNVGGGVSYYSPLVYHDRVGTTRHWPSPTRLGPLPPKALISSFSHSSTLFCTFLRSAKTQALSFQSNTHSCRKTPGGGVPPQTLASGCELSAVNYQLLFTRHSSLATRHSPLPPEDLTSSFSYSSTLFCTFLRSAKPQALSFQANPHSCRKTPGVGVPHKPSRPAVSCQLSTISCFSLATRHSSLATSSHDPTTHL
jgi:hypothetical protein